MADTFKGELYTKRHSVFTVTPAGGGAYPGKGQTFNFKRTAEQTELKSGGHVVSRATAERVETLTLDWTWAAYDPSDITGFTAPAIDEVVTVAGLSDAINGDWNVKDFTVSGQEGQDWKGQVTLQRNNGDALHEAGWY